ncbi:MAG TPA: VOC family protein [Paraburkholderia sp.]|uniref:2-oxoadipate dioxygenase/decarboxylase HglS n=1 Tax=Paraburkholderia sp. TaxID=1926495 RepID=UPI002B47077C|nr:VOC family protein [Paraburkholderia sp.]HKR38445.1 VOC family protein [Paraburkholderia sp.]
MNQQRFVPEAEIRGMFSEAMSRMYREEVPLYGDLLDIVLDVNIPFLNANPHLATDPYCSDDFRRVGQERHGAIRLGTAEELSVMRRVLAVMGLHPVGYYDLSVAGVPVHSTAFRPIDPDSLNENPFRIFTSLLRLELIEDADLRAEAKRLLEQRKIYSDRAISLVEQYERQGGLNAASAASFVEAVLETFRWHAEALVDAATYAKLHDAHRLLADVVCFKGPHINHLTPRTLDIDAAQQAMRSRGLDAKSIIEGPPRRAVPILLRQTSFKALEETVRFSGDADVADGTHTARFGEIEQRGLALTRKGRALYDALLQEARGNEGAGVCSYRESLEHAFQKFPDDLDTIRRDGLGYFHYSVVGDVTPEDAQDFDLDALVARGVVRATPVLYEDFLPVSAAGIFQSNLGTGEPKVYSPKEEQAAFEQALGTPVADPFTLYEAIERKSIAAVKAALSPASA